MTILQNKDVLCTVGGRILRINNVVKDVFCCCFRGNVAIVWEKDRHLFGKDNGLLPLG